jgi:GcrA cell cycle regulator
MLAEISHTASTSFVEGGGKSLLQLAANECKWPIGDPRKAGFCFCGAKRVEGFPYCYGHARIAYN